jgi:hypothetical protein
MNGQEGKLAALALGLIAAGALLVNYGKPRLGNPGLAIERTPLTNELGAVVRQERVRLPASAGGFRSQDTPITALEVAILPPDTTFGRKFFIDDEGFGVQMSAVMMKTDRTSIHRPQICITGQGWNIQKTEIIDIPVALPIPYILKATCLTSTKMVRDARTGKEAPRSSVYVYWFVSENRLLPGHSEALWAITRDLVTSGVLYPWAYVSCYAECPPGLESLALSRMKRLISGAAPQFQLTPSASKQTAFLQTSPSLQ